MVELDVREGGDGDDLVDVTVKEECEDVAAVVEGEDVGLGLGFVERGGGGAGEWEVYDCEED